VDWKAGGVRRLAALFSIALLGLAACAKSPPDDRRLRPAVTARPAEPKPVTVQKGPNRLSLDPGVVSACDGGALVATVNWSSADPSVSGVDIRVGKGDLAETRVFTSGGSQGTAKTGPWVSLGSRFVMTDHASGRALLEYVVAEMPCE
jgi:hypothetical protein